MARKEAPPLAGPTALPPASAPEPAPAPTRTQVLAVLALALGAVGMAASTVFVRLAEVGPFASAFWRMLLALPFLWLWLHYERARKGASREPALTRRSAGPVFLLGFLFAGDLFFWHLAILNTTVANATLLANMSPIVVALGAGLVLKEQVPLRVLIGLVCGVGGAMLIVGGSASFQPQHLAGDLYGFITALFFGSYMLTMVRARRQLSSATAMFYPAIVTTAFMLVAALLLDDRLLPHSWQGVSMLVALALVSQVGGQGLAAYAFGYLPAVFSSLVIFVETLAAACLGYLFFAEAISTWQIAGGALILAGIYAARPRRGT